MIGSCSRHRESVLILPDFRALPISYAFVNIVCAIAQAVIAVSLMCFPSSGWGAHRYTDDADDADTTQGRALSAIASPVFQRRSASSLLCLRLAGPLPLAAVPPAAFARLRHLYTLLGNSAALPPGLGWLSLLAPEPADAAGFTRLGTAVQQHTRL